MRDPRNARLADLIVSHSTQLEPGEAMFIESFDLAGDLVVDLVEAVQRRGAIPIVHIVSTAVQRALLSGDRKSTRLNSSHLSQSRMPSSA